MIDLSLNGLTTQQIDTLVHLRDWFLTYNRQTEPDGPHPGVLGTAMMFPGDD